MVLNPFWKISLDETNCVSSLRILIETFLSRPFSVILYHWTIGVVGKPYAKQDRMTPLWSNGILSAKEFKTCGEDEKTEAMVAAYTKTIKHD